MSHKTVGSSMQEVEVQRAALQDLEAALLTLRGSSLWEKDIGKDQRLSVKLLYAQFVSRREALTVYLATGIQLGGQE